MNSGPHRRFPSPQTPFVRPPKRGATELVRWIALAVFSLAAIGCPRIPDPESAKAQAAAEKIIAEAAAKKKEETEALKAELAKLKAAAEANKIADTSALPADSVEPDTGAAHVTKVVREVRLLAANEKARPAALNDQVTEGVSIATGDRSRSEITFPDITITRLGANSLFSFDRAGHDAHLGGGSLLLRVPKNSGGSVRSDIVTVAITGTTLILEAEPGGRTKVIMLEGRARVALAKFPRQVRRVSGGQLLDIPENATSMPRPQAFDLRELMRKHPLVAEFSPLPSRALIMAVADAADAPKNAAVPPKSRAPADRDQTDDVDDDDDEPVIARGPRGNADAARREAEAEANARADAASRIKTQRALDRARADLAASEEAITRNRADQIAGDKKRADAAARDDATNRAKEQADRAQADAIARDDARTKAEADAQEDARNKAAADAEKARQTEADEQAERRAKEYAQREAAEAERKASQKKASRRDAETPPPEAEGANAPPEETSPDLR